MKRIVNTLVIDGNGDKALEIRSIPMNAFIIECSTPELLDKLRAYYSDGGGEDELFNNDFKVEEIRDSKDNYIGLRVIGAYE